jgi:hypothetical protein
VDWRLALLLMAYTVNPCFAIGSALMRFFVAA